MKPKLVPDGRACVATEDGSVRYVVRRRRTRPGHFGHGSLANRACIETGRARNRRAGTTTSGGVARRGDRHRRGCHGRQRSSFPSHARAPCIALARAIVFAVAPARPQAGLSRGSVAFALTSGALDAAIAIAVLSRVFVTATAAAAMVASVVAALATLALARGLCVYEVPSPELLKKLGIDRMVIPRTCRVAVAAAAAAAAAVAAAATDLIGLWRTWVRIVACSGRSAGRLVATIPQAGKKEPLRRSLEAAVQVSTFRAPDGQTQTANHMIKTNPI